MRTSTAYFAGVGTVVAAITIGLGGGWMVAEIVSPHEPKQEISRLARRMSAETIPVSAAPSEPVPYVAASQPQQNVPPMEGAPAAAPPQTTAVREPAASPDDANAKARSVDAKRASADKRRVERRQQWTERRRQRRQDDELRDVEQKVREETGAPRMLTADPVRMEAPRIRPFDPSDN